MFDKYSLVQRLQELPFSKEEYWVVAGGAMVLHGFRLQTQDIDLGCSTSLADRLEQQGTRSRTVKMELEKSYINGI